ncbi:hypothetical protein L6452_18397 [Arctium lappa]|uniref:Uncharacterized protein n=1 Tax=Arctium lappa TaxID=4217 RepID=A0ACB9C6D3_ARCLA|nr:hypothetical protein L6452_18397 [Arctium lappa]
MTNDIHLLAEKGELPTRLGSDPLRILLLQHWHRLWKKPYLDLRWMSTEEKSLTKRLQQQLPKTLIHLIILTHF